MIFGLKLSKLCAFYMIGIWGWGAHTYFDFAYSPYAYTLVSTFSRLSKYIKLETNVQQKFSFSFPCTLIFIPHIFLINIFFKSQIAVKFWQNLRRNSVFCKHSASFCHKPLWRLSESCIRNCMKICTMLRITIKKQSVLQSIMLRICRICLSL